MRACAAGARALCVAWLALAAAGAVSAPVPQEYQVKAIFLFNFTQFVDWPGASAAQEPIAICVLGEDPFGNYLDDALRGEHVGNRALAVRRYRRVDEVRGCQVLFISRSETRHIDDAIAQVRGAGTLTVSDADDFAARGGMVGFVTEDDHVRLRINVAATHAAGISISSKLLHVAEIIGDSR
jgi:hypothetical protein